MLGGSKSDLQWMSQGECSQHPEVFHSSLLEYDQADHDFLALSVTDPRTGDRVLLTREQAKAGKAHLQIEAKAICASCPVIEQCSAWAMGNTFFGVAAGMTDSEARAARGRNRIKVPAVDTAAYAGLQDQVGRTRLQPEVAERLTTAGWTAEQIAEEYQVSTRTVARARSAAAHTSVTPHQDRVPITVAVAAAEKVIAMAIENADRAAAVVAQRGPVDVDQVVFGSPAPSPVDTGASTGGPVSFTPIPAPAAPAFDRADDSGAPQPGDAAPSKVSPVSLSTSTPWMRAVWSVLADGAPHTFDEILTAAAPYVSDDEAIATWQKNYEQQRRKRGGAGGRPVPLSQQIVTGRKAKVKNGINAAARLRGQIVRRGGTYSAAAHVLPSIAALRASA